MSIRVRRITDKQSGHKERDIRRKSTATDVSLSDGAARRFDELDERLERLLYADERKYISAYFERIEASVELARAACLAKVNKHYDDMRALLNARKAACLARVDEKSVELDAIRESLARYKRDLGSFHEFYAQTVLGDDDDNDNDNCFEDDDDNNNNESASAAKVFQTVREWDKPLMEEREWQALRDDVSAYASELDSLLLAGTHVSFEASAHEPAPWLARLDQTDYRQMIDSLIVCGHESRRSLAKLCASRLRADSPRPWRLAYRATRDGFSHVHFHARCDGLASTLTLVRTVDGWVFGAYTAAKWGQRGQFVTDPRAFLFSWRRRPGNNNNNNDDNSDDETPILIPVTCPQFAVFSSFAFGPTFGDGYDLHIASDSNLNCKSFSCLAYAYKLRPVQADKVNAAATADTLLAGSRYFQTSEIEVFHLD